MSRVDWPLPEVHVACCAAKLPNGDVIGVDCDALVTPASVMKLQVALTALTAIHAGRLDGAAPVSLEPADRTPGPVGISLMEDTVRMSVRDLIVLMMTISDNVATDALIELVGLDAINATTRRLGMDNTKVTSSLKQMLDKMATEVGFTDFVQLGRHDPAIDGPPREADARRAISESAALDPRRGSCTTAADMVRLLRALWIDEAAPAEVCARLRRLMTEQITRHRIAAGFDPGFAVAAKSGGLMGVVRNEVGVVTDPEGVSYAIAVFTRRPPRSTAAPAQIDAAIGQVARDLVRRLASTEEKS